MAAPASFEIHQYKENSPARDKPIEAKLPPAQRHTYALRSRTARPQAPRTAGSLNKSVTRKRSKGKTRLVLRRSRVKQGVCGNIKVTKRRVTIKPSSIKQQEFVVPVGPGISSPTKVVIKTNPLFKTNEKLPRSTPTLLNRRGCSQKESGVASEVFYGQRGKIRRTKEQEMISAVMDLMEHGEKKKKTPLLQKIRSLGQRRGKSTKITSNHYCKGGRTLTHRSPLLQKDSNSDMYQMLTQV